MDRNYQANAVDQILPGSLSARRAWIEIRVLALSRLMAMSLSARRAWIEIEATPSTAPSITVALRKESVDRNLRVANCVLHAEVALRKESVDRNIHAAIPQAHQQVALRKESVDRNLISR